MEGGLCIGPEDIREVSYFQRVLCTDFCLYVHDDFALQVQLKKFLFGGLLFMYMYICVVMYIYTGTCACTCTCTCTCTYRVEHPSID